MIRSKKGVLVSIGKDKNGKLSIILDDVIQDGTDKVWKKDAFYTINELSENDLENISFSDDYLEGLGLSVLARIAAFKMLKEI